MEYVGYAEVQGSESGLELFLERAIPGLKLLTHYRLVSDHEGPYELGEGSNLYFVGEENIQLETETDEDFIPGLIWSEFNIQAKENVQPHKVAKFTEGTDLRVELFLTNQLTKKVRTIKIESGEVFLDEE